MPDLNSVDENGSTILHYAVTKNNYEAVFQLINLPTININVSCYSTFFCIYFRHKQKFLFYFKIEDRKKLTPLEIACIKSVSDDIANLLIDATDVEKLSNRLTIHLICKNKEDKFFLAKKILEKVKTESKQEKNYLAALLKKEDPNKKTILHVATEYKQLKIVESLFRDYNADKDVRDGKNGNYLIHLAAKQASTDLMHILEKYDAVSFKQNFNLENALHVAAQNNASRFLRRLLDYEKTLVNKIDNENFITCICKCEFCECDYVPQCVQLDKKKYTPLMSALAALNHKCVEEIISVNENVDVDMRDIEGNNMLQICAQFNNVESLNYLINKYLNSKNMGILESKNLHDETILHVACRHGNLEIIKIVLNTVYESDLCLEAILYSQNKDGQTCFHISCLKGYLNIVEYFLKDRKLKSFLDYFDDSMNSSLHFATLSGNLSIVNLLLDNEVDVNAVNEENLSALDLSCRKGYFEISKVLISHYSTINEINNPLETACYEGAHEVVSLLLSKGAAIGKINDENKNCLDIAISRGHREVIRVLLNDKNWQNLIRLSNEPSEEPSLSIITSHSLTDADKQKQKEKEAKFVENPQLNAMFDHRLWDCFKMVLDKCIGEKNEIDFTKIDTPVKSITRHPLMLIALSGQENLLKHPTTRALLRLKWRYIPRFVYYSNLMFYLTFLCLMSVYSIELANNGPKSFSNDKLNSFYNNKTQMYEYKVKEQTSPYLFGPLLFILILSLMKELSQLLYDGFSYFTSIQKLIEMVTYSLSLTSLIIDDYEMKCAYGSLSILFAFIVFPLYVQKLKIFGVYVVAFLRTLKNSAKFFPIFLIIYVGFILSFKIRSNFGVNYFNSTAYSLIRTISMISGEFDTNKMGLHEGNIPNFIIYMLFIGLMCTILINLFVGIAVGEIKTVLDEADIQQTSMRIIFLLKVQSALNPLEKTYFKRFVDMNYKKYKPDDEHQLMKFLDNVKKKLKEIFISNEPTIILSDPQKRLEDMFNEISKNTNEEIKTIKTTFNVQINEVENRLLNSQTRVEDCLNEISRKSNSTYDNMNSDSNSKFSVMQSKLVDVEKSLIESMGRISRQTVEEINYFKIVFNEKIMRLEEKFMGVYNSSLKKLNENVDQANKNVNHQAYELNKVYDKLNKSSLQIANELANIKQNSIVSIENKIESFHEILEKLNENIFKISEKLSLDK